MMGLLYGGPANGKSVEVNEWPPPKVIEVRGEKYTRLRTSHQAVVGILGQRGASLIYQHAPLATPQNVLHVDPSELPSSGTIAE